MDSSFIDDEINESLLNLSLEPSSCNCNSTCSRASGKGQCPCRAIGQECTDRCTCGTKKKACCNKPSDSVSYTLGHIPNIKSEIIIITFDSYTFVLTACGLVNEEGIILHYLPKFITKEINASNPFSIFSTFFFIIINYVQTST